MPAGFEELAAVVAARLETDGQAVVGIDGPCGAGKSRLAGRLAERFPGSALFHADDFFLQPRQRTKERLSEPGGNMDRERLAGEVLEQLKSGRPFTYRRYDCKSGVLTRVDAAPTRLVIVEGAYCLHPDLRRYYSLKVFLDAPRGVRLERIARRNPEQAARFLSEWIPLEDRYFQAFNVRSAADIVLNGLPESVD